MCEQNKLGMVDSDLVRCLSCDLIPKLLIEKYLVEICRTQNVPFEPDATVMAQDEFWTLGQRYVQNPNVNDDNRRPPPPPSGPSSSSGGGGIGGVRMDYPAPTLTPPSAPTVSFLSILFSIHPLKRENFTYSNFFAQFEKTPPVYVGVSFHSSLCELTFSFRDASSVWNIFI